MYDHLDSVVKSVSKRDFFIVGGDLNAKTGSSLSKYQQDYWKYIKVTANTNGYELNLCMRMYLVLINTYIKHKMTHRTTCQCPDIASAMHKDDTPRKNHVRNQIEYIHHCKVRRIMENSYPRQCVPRATHTQNNSCTGLPVPKTNCTQDSSYAGQLVPKTTRTKTPLTQDQYHPRQLVLLWLTKLKQVKKNFTCSFEIIILWINFT